MKWLMDLVAERNSNLTLMSEAPEPEEHPLLSALRDLQPDEMSPKEALEKLYELRRHL